MVTARHLRQLYRRAPDLLPFQARIGSPGQTGRAPVPRALAEHQTFTFDYDFSDGWEHDVVIEELIHSDTGLKFAVCLDGEQACSLRPFRGGLP